MKNTIIDTNAIINMENQIEEDVESLKVMIREASNAKDLETRKKFSDCAIAYLKQITDDYDELHDLKTEATLERYDLTNNGGRSSFAHMVVEQEGYANTDPFDATARTALYDFLIENEIKKEDALETMGWYDIETEDVLDCEEEGCNWYAAGWKITKNEKENFIEAVQEDALCGRNTALYILGECWYKEFKEEILPKLDARFDELARNSDLYFLENLIFDWNGQEWSFEEYKWANQLFWDIFEDETPDWLMNYIPDRVTDDEDNIIW